MSNARCRRIRVGLGIRPWLCGIGVVLCGSVAIGAQSSAGYEASAHIARLSTMGMVDRVRTTTQIEQGAAIESILHAAGLARLLRDGMGPNGTIGLDDSDSVKSERQIKVFNGLLKARGIDARLERVVLDGTTTFHLIGGSGDAVITVDVGPDLREWADHPLHVSVLEQMGVTWLELNEDGRFAQAVQAATGDVGEAGDAGGAQPLPATISSQCTVGAEGCTSASTCTTSKCTSGSCTSSTGCTQDSCTAGSCTSGSECTVGDGCTRGGDCTAGKNCTGSDSCTKGDKCTRGGNCTGSNSCTSSSEACTSGSYCTSSGGGMCTRGPACTSGSECTGGDSCSHGTHCTQGPGGCTQGGQCTTGEFCSMGSNCTNGSSHGCTQSSCSSASRCTYGPCTNATKCTDGSACSSGVNPCAYTYQSGCTYGGGCPPPQSFLHRHGESGSLIQLADHSFARVTTFMTSPSQTASFAWAGLLLFGMVPWRQGRLSTIKTVQSDIHN